MPLSANPATLESGLAHLIGHDVTVNVHDGTDIGVTHKTLLHNNRRSYSVKP